MIQEIVRSSNNRLVVEIPDEYVGRELNVLVYSGDEVIKKQREEKTKKMLKKFKEISKNISTLEDKNIDITKIDMDMYDDIF